MLWRDEVRAVDAGEALGDDGADPEVERRERRVLARGPLAVVVAAGDEAAAPASGAVVELGVMAAEHVLRAVRDVRPQAHPDRAVGRHVAGGDVVADDDRHAPVDGRRAAAAGAAARRCSRAADDLDARSVAGGGGATICAVVDLGSRLHRADGAAGSPSVRGSVIAPRSAVAAAVAGEHR